MKKIIVTVFLGICLFAVVCNLSAHPMNGYSIGIGSLKAPAYTEAELKLSTPTVAGLLFYDSTNSNLIISTGTTTSFDYGQSNSGTTAPSSW